VRVDSKGERPSLTIPIDHRVSYYFDAVAGSELVIPKLTGGDSKEGPYLRVNLQASGATVAQVSDFARGGVRLSLPGEEGEIVRISLGVYATPPKAGLGAKMGRALGRLTGRGGQTEMVLHAPKVRQPTGTDLPSATTSDVVTTAAVAPTGSQEADKKPNVIIYLIDTLRADHLGVYGYDRPTSPNIDAFARRATLFRHAQAQSSWTRTAVTSIITGLNPQSHRVNGRTDMLPDSAITLAEYLKEEGYLTIGYITNGNVDARFAMDQGYDYYVRLRESRDKREVHILSDAVNETVFRFFDVEEIQEPYFLFIHVSDPHAPYMPPEPFRSRFAKGVPADLGLIDNVRPFSNGDKVAPPGTRQAFTNLYDAEIAFNDHHFGRLIAGLEALDQFDDSLILLISDHGEEFFEHGGWEHGRTLNGDQLNVPMILKLPGGVAAGLELDPVVRQVDVLPTLLDTLGVEIPADLDGQSLLPLMRRQTVARPPVSYSLLLIDDRVLEGAVARGWKLVQDLSAENLSPVESLYNLSVDPLEQVDVKDENPLQRGYLRQALRALRYAQRSRQRESPEAAVIEDELQMVLESLGYLQGR
jgi:arylsulfatase A-like enzyme